MTVLNFPASPTNGQVYTENGVIYTWNGTYWAANNAQDLDGRFVNITGDTMTGDLTVPSMNSGPLAGFRNLIINPNFSINQRGGTRTPGVATYGFDRWRGAQDGANTMLEQIIEDAPAGRYTLSIVGGTNIATQRLSAHYANTSAIALGVVGERTLTFDFNGTTAPLAIFVPTDVDSVQVEFGDVATPHERRPIGLELALCQRYYYGIDAYWAPCMGEVTNKVNAHFYLPTTMRTLPTVTNNADAAAIAVNGALFDLIANTGVVVNGWWRGSNGVISFDTNAQAGRWFAGVARIAGLGLNAEL